MFQTKINIFVRMVLLISLFCMITACTPNIERLIEKGDMERLIEAADYEDNPGIREQAVNALVEFDHPDVTNAIINALNDDAPEVRAAAANALGELNDPKSYKSIITALGDDNEIVRDKAKQALEAIGPPASASLIEALSSQNENIKSGAYEILVDNGEAFGKRLIVALPKEESEQSQIIVDILMDVGEPIIIDLIDSFSEAQEERNQLISEILVDLGDISVPYLVDSLIDPSSIVREMSAYTLGCLKATSAINSLIETLNDTNEVRWAAENALVNIGTPAINPLIETLKHGDENLKSKISTPLSTILTQQDVEVRNNVIKQLLEIYENGDETTKTGITFTLRPVFRDTLADRVLQDAQKICNEEAVLGASDYEQSRYIVPYVIYDEDEKTLHPWTLKELPINRLPWEAEQLSTVICLHNWNQKVEECKYYSGREYKDSRIHYQRVLRVIIRDIYGSEIIQTEFRGSKPDECPYYSSFFGSFYGDPVNFNQLWTWLAGSN